MVSTLPYINSWWEPETLCFYIGSPGQLQLVGSGEGAAVPGVIVYTSIQLQHCLDFFTSPGDGYGEGGGGVEEEEDEGVYGRVGDYSHPDHRLGGNMLMVKKAPTN